MKLPEWFFVYCLIPGLFIGMIAHAINIYSALKRASERKEEDHEE